jgi:adenine deaminase
MNTSQSPRYTHKRKMLHEVTLNVVATAMGREPADLIIKNGRLVNVNVGRIQDGMTVAVRDGIIAYVGKGNHLIADKHTKVIDATGRFLVPGFIDTHDHVESSMVDVVNFAEAILPHGTTTIACDNHEITNVFGIRAVELFHKAAQGLPLKVLVAMPVCVPSIPGFEDAGDTITAKEVTQAYQKGWAQVQGEQMNFPGVIYGDPNVHAITAASLKSGNVLTGHYASLELDKGLPAFIAAGLMACHEATTAEAAMRRAELGCYAQQRYGTAWLDMPNTIKAITENPGLDTRFFTMITDDVTPASICEYGHVSRVVRDAIKQGVPPILAIQMVTINAAQLLERSRWIGTISPGRAADILIVSDLVNMIIDQVFADGVLVAENGKMVIGLSCFDYPDWAMKSIHLPQVSEADFRVPMKKKVKIRVMRIYPGMVHTTTEFTEIEPVNGSLQADPAKDLVKVANFYRHEPRPEVTKIKGIGFATGLQFKSNSAYASTVSHDCHNLQVIGTSDKAMALAANELIRAGGGHCVVVDGKVEALMPLPLGGLMSLESVEVVSKQLKAIEDGLKKAGCMHDSVEMTISLLGLIVLEELHLSNQGLVELKPGQPPRFVDLVVAE